MYDVTNRDSFDKIRTWAAQIEEYGDGNLCKLLVGNKTDKEHERMVSKEEGANLAKSLGIDFLETSAKDTSNVEAAFTKLAVAILHSFQFVPLLQASHFSFISFHWFVVCLFCCRSGSFPVSEGGTVSVASNKSSSQDKKCCRH